MVNSSWHTAFSRDYCIICVIFIVKKWLFQYHILIFNTESAFSVSPNTGYRFDASKIRLHFNTFCELCDITQIFARFLALIQLIHLYIPRGELEKISHFSVACTLIIQTILSLKICDNFLLSLLALVQPIHQYIPKEELEKISDFFHICTLFIRAAERVRTGKGRDLLYYAYSLHSLL